MDMEKISVYMPGQETEGSKLAAQQAMHSQYVLQLLQLQRRAGFLCDITVNIQDKSFKAHKPLLAACSLYFRALFADGEKAKPSTLNFDEKLSAGGFKVLLDYIYSGSLAITSANSDQVLHAANCLQMTNVVETCLNFIRSSFKATTSDVNTLDAIPPMDKEMQSTIQATSNPQILPLGTPTISAVHQNLQESQQFQHTEVPGHQALPPVQQSPQIPQSFPGHLSQIQLYEHHARMRSAYENAGQNHIATALQTQAPEVKENVAIEHLASHLPIATPTSETLTMQYLVAKNARRPTLNEVRQLLLSGQRHGSLPVKSPERYPLKQPPPALIPANDAYVERNDAGFDEMTSVLQQPSGTFSPEKQSPLNMTTPRSSVGEVISLDGNPQYNANNMKLLSRANSLHRSEGSSTTSRTTVHAGQTFDVKNAQLSTKGMQPFVLMSPGNNALVPRALRSSDDGSKGCAWSDDRSVGSNQTSDQSATHLSGTPCTAGLTRDSLTTSDECWQQRLFQATSPASFGSTPSIEISPVSVTTSESPTMESPTAKKIRCTRAQSLDFSNILKSAKTANRSITRSTDDFRSSSLSPGFFSEQSSSNCVGFKLGTINSKKQVPGDHSSLISPEQAASAVGALFVGAMMERQKHVPERHSSADDSSRLVIDEHPDISDHLPDTDAESRGSSGLPKSENHNTYPATYTNSENYDDLRESRDVPVNDAQNPQNEDRVVVKKEPEPGSRMSPPLEQSFYPSGQEDNLSQSTNSSHDCSVDENGVLDLSIQKPSTTTSVPQLQVTKVFSRNSLHHPGQDSRTSITQGRDSKAQDALDALVMMQNASKPTDAMPPQAFPASANLALEDNNMAMTFGFSRKPRRSSGGQTCQWPGCGRLFRHRNIYEEHKKLHEMGVPVHQLRKCYMGARVKKTARERLEEMRDARGEVEGSGGSQATDSLDPDPNISNYQRPNNSRKRGANSHKEGPDRKRVTAKDRKDIARNLPWQPQQSSLATIQHAPLFSHMPSIPLAVLQAASSSSSLRQPWQAGQPAGGVPRNVLGFPSGPSGPIATSHHQSPAHNNAAVVETLAALGIPIPAKRDEDHAARLGMPSVMMQSPTKTMTMDQLRRTVALRETTVSGAASSGNKAAVYLQPPIPQPLSSQQGIGKVTGNSMFADAAPVPRSVGNWESNHVSSGIEMPAPNNNHVNHGEKCS